MSVSPVQPIGQIETASEEYAPEHVAIIMDGNGRWANARGLPRTAGHKRGADAVKRTVKGAGELGIKYLTLFGFSSENWRRPESEVRDLLGLLQSSLENNIVELESQGIRLKVIGDRKRLPDETVALIKDAERRTAVNSRLILTIALSYGSRNEIIAATKSIASECAVGNIMPSDIDENMFGSRLFTSGTPDPDLLIRTSGEQRISNFLLWQIAYTELVFTETLWPDFDKGELESAIAEFRRRERRFGAVKS
ncbi:MAG: di-trans,poly-cis-decaprenylcistransferase [Candidatus Marinimicrobia bacterium]|nr:di-trans,poly-cis-decaprenylcistransferase [Candidatus Neomarinimicrobiota bacterium]